MQDFTHMPATATARVQVQQFGEIEFDECTRRVVTAPTRTKASKLEKLGLRSVSG